MQISFKYCIVPKDHKSEEEIKANAVEGAMRPKLLLEAMQDGGIPPEHWNVAALFVDNAFIPLIKMEMYVKDNNINLRCTLQGCQPLKKKNKDLTY